MSGLSASKNLYRFSSKEWNPNSGLYYYGYRFYDPNLQRWVNADPVQEDGGINLYGFVANAPVNEADAMGLGFGNPVPPIVVTWPVDKRMPPMPPPDTTGREFWNELTDPNGYTHCFASCMLGLPTAVDFGNELGLGKEAARRYYTFRYPKWFRAGGRYSKVLVPKLAARISWALLPMTARDIAECYNKCRAEGGTGSSGPAPGCCGPALQWRTC